MLGLKENNLATPDIPQFELKTHREGTNNLITLFTFNKKAWRMNPLDAIKKYGSYDKNGRKGMYYTMSTTPNSVGLFLNVENKDEVSIQHRCGEVIATWKLKELENRFINKLPALLFVSAKTEERDGREYFHFYRVQLMEHTSTEILKDLLEMGDILVDLRLHDKKTRARNHGTGFRIYEKNLHKLFKRIKDLS